MHCRLALIALLLSACTLAGPGSDTATTAAPGEIEVTTLDSATAGTAGAEAAADAADTAATAPAAAPDGPEPDAPPETGAGEPDRAGPDAAGGTGAASGEAAGELAEPPPAPALSPEAQACVKRGGRWVGTGASGLMACVRITRDAGKSCRRQGDCQGYCLARSRTCAPYTPLFGCNDVLGPNGERTTICLD